MSANCRVYDSHHLQPDCQEPGSAREPYAWQSSDLNMEGSFASSCDTDGDPVVWTGRLKPFLSYRTRFSALSSVKEHSGSSASLASITGSTQNLLDSTKLMTLQDDARCRRISSEVMKRCLYKSEAPCRRRRAYSQMYGRSARSRMVQSMPVTPSQSHSVSPSRSPTNMTGSMYTFLSRGTTPRAVTPETEDGEEEDNRCDAGIASVLRPQPRYVRALPPPRLEEVADETDDTVVDGTQTAAFETAARPSYHFHSLSAAAAHNAL